MKPISTGTPTIQPSIDAGAATQDGANQLQNDAKRDPSKDKQAPAPGAKDAHGKDTPGTQSSPAETLARHSAERAAERGLAEGGRTPADGTGTNAATLNDKGISSLATGDTVQSAAEAARAVRLIVGEGDAELRVAENAPTGGDHLAQIERHVGPLLERLAAKSGEPGQKFSSRDGLKNPQSAPIVPFRQSASLAREANIDPSLIKSNERVRMVVHYQALIEKTFSLQAQQTALTARISAMPFLARNALAASINATSRIAGAFRAQEPRLWRGAIKLDGKPAALRVQIESWFAELEKGPANGASDTDVVLPAPGFEAFEKRAGEHVATEVADFKALLREVGVRSNLEPQVTSIVSNFKSAMKAGAIPHAFDPMAGIDWDSADVNELMQLVLMQGVRLENDSTKAMLKDMQRSNRQKDALRQALTQAKQNQAGLERRMQNEFNEFKATGAINDKITIDQYKAWREIDFAGLDESLQDDGERTYTMPTPQMQEITTADIPTWMHTGEVDKAGSADDPAATQKAFGLEPKMDSKLRAIFNKLKPEGLSYVQWLQSDVKLSTVSSIGEIVSNLQAVKAFVASTTRAKVDAATAVGGANGPGSVAQELKDAYLSYAKAEMLHQAFPEMVNSEAVTTAKRAYEQVRSKGPDGTPLNAADAAAFKRWQQTDAGVEISQYKDQIHQFNNALVDPTKFSGGPHREGNTGWSDERYQKQFGNGQTVPGDVHFKLVNGEYKLVKTIEVDMGDVDPNSPFYKQMAQQLGNVISGARHLGDAVKEGFQSIWGGGDGGDGEVAPDYTYLVDCDFQDGGNPILADINKLKSANPPSQVTVIEKAAYDVLMPTPTPEGLEVTVDGETFKISWKDLQQSMIAGAIEGGVAGSFIGEAAGAVLGAVEGGLLGSALFGVGVIPGAVIGMMVGAVVGATIGLAVGAAVGGAAAGYSAAQKEFAAKVAEHFAKKARTGHDVSDGFDAQFLEKTQANPPPLSAEEQAKAAAHEADVNAIMSDLNSLSTMCGSATGLSPDYARWARENGLDTDYNDAQAAKGKVIKPPRPAPIDPSTGIRLGCRGSLEMLGAATQAIQDKLETLKDFGEMEQLRLQRQMERTSKLVETLSNLVKAISDTEDNIVSNMK